MHQDQTTIKMSYVVDNFEKPANIIVNLGTTNISVLRFCGIRSTHYMPGDPDIISANGFEHMPL